MLRRLAVYSEMIKLQHTVFALPFALFGAFLGARGLPPARVLLWVVLAVAGARTAAMAFNRLVDRRVDAANPRTAGRALAAGTVRPAEGWALVAAGVALFLLACARLNPLALALAPLVLALTLGYSFTKRFTWLCHLVLGSALALAPFGGYVAARGEAAGYPLALSLGVVAWVAGFDTLYACLDEGFDRRAGLFSLPARFGRTAALRLARLLHLAAFLGFLAAGVQARLGLPYDLGLGLCALALVLQHRVVRPEDLSRMQLAFFHLNGAVSVTLFAAAWIGLGVG